MEVSAQHVEDDVLSRDLLSLDALQAHKIQLLKSEWRIHTIEEFLLQFPFRYEDRSKFHTIGNLHSHHDYVQLQGSVEHLALQRTRHRIFLSARLYDKSGSVELRWYNGLKWWREALKENTEYVIYGKLSVYKNRPVLVHPEVREAHKRGTSMAFSPIYHSSAELAKNGLDSPGIMRLQKKVLRRVSAHIEEILPPEILREHELMSRKEALKRVHFPTTHQEATHARRRMHFEMLFLYQFALLDLSAQRKKNTRGAVFSGRMLARKFSREVLKFSLTNAQKRVVNEIYQDMAHGYQMSRLLQGDVGSGKTVVAFLGMLAAVEAGAQVAFMVPTEVLADQHFYNLMQYAAPLGLRVGKLSSSTPKKEREALHKALKNNTLQVLIGTHALLEEAVQFAHLGLVVVDEQHRFGVGQRATLWQKATDRLPHVLVMTATPIPRTLAMTRYGDLDVSVIDELPAGRAPTKTVHRYYPTTQTPLSDDEGSSRIYEFMRRELEQGRQVYVVYPTIEDSELLSLRHLKEGHSRLCGYFSDFRVDMLHGKMKAQDKQEVMHNFAQGHTNMLVSTTVIEVGVDVSNAVIMLIEHAERFGLAQLHQLRAEWDEVLALLIAYSERNARYQKRLSNA